MGDGYDAGVIEGMDVEARSSARRVAALVSELVRPSSVLDVGCGTGAWLAEFASLGADRVVGVDRDVMAVTGLRIDPSDFVPADLAGAPLPVQGPFDLALCLEVVEHLTPDRASELVAELCRMAPVVLFSGPIPDQGGIGQGPFHCRWPDEWADVFDTHGHRSIDAVRLEVWADESVAWWYRQNVVLYASDEAIAASAALAELRRTHGGRPHRLVHPGLFSSVVRHPDLDAVAARNLVRAAARVTRNRVVDLAGRSRSDVDAAAGR